MNNSSNASCFANNEKWLHYSDFEKERPNEHKQIHSQYSIRDLNKKKLSTQRKTPKSKKSDLIDFWNWVRDQIQTKQW